MSGFIHSPLGDIQDLRGILTDQYDISSIVRELIQNADDSRARSLHIRVDPGSPDAGHPLLQGPSLLFLNDGAFSQADAIAILRIRQGTKGGDHSTIGKFGLGLKSVFHLCEAFFFAASPNPDESKGDFFLQILNPWTGTDVEPGLHDVWNGTSFWNSANEYIGRQLQAWPHGAESWFCLWIPLRREDQLDGIAPIVPPPFPTDAAILTSDLPQRVANCFPLLKHLERVSVWRSEPGTIQCEYTVELVEGSTRALRDDLKPGSRKRLAGEVVKHSPSGKVTLLLFSGIEQRLASPHLETLGNSDSWPVTQATDRKGITVTSREPALQHCAVVFSRVPAAAGGLSISHGFVLPLGEALHAPRNGSQAEFQLLLHGWFFLDRGRRALLPPPAHGTVATARVEVLWNQSLEELGILPEVPFALGRFVEREVLSSKEIDQLTGELMRCSWARAKRVPLGKTHQWMLTLALGKSTWQLLGAEKPFRELPDVKGDDYDLPFLALPGLKGVTSTHALTATGRPRLSKREPELWRDETRWLDGLNFAELFSHPERLEYLNAFLAVNRGWEKAVLQQLADLCRSTFSDNGFHALTNTEAATKAFHGFLQRLGAESWIKVGKDACNEKEIPRVAQLLNGIRQRFVTIPESLSPNSQTDAVPNRQFSVSEAHSILTSLAEQTTDLNVDTPSSVAFWVLRRTDAPTEEQRKACGSIQLFRIQGRSETRRASWNELVDLARKNQLVTDSRSTLHETMQGAIPSLILFQLKENATDANELLFPTPPEQITPLNVAKCLAILRARPKLGDEQSRAVLLEQLLKHPNISKPELRSDLRYLLHGRHQDAGAILLCSGRSTSPAMAKLIRHLLTKQNQKWRLVDQKLAGVIAGQHWDPLGMEEFSSKRAAELIKETGTQALEDLTLSPPEAEELLIELRDADFWLDADSWLDLPLHRTDGSDSPIRANRPSTYFQQRYEVPDYLKHRVRARQTTTASFHSGHSAFGRMT